MLIAMAGLPGTGKSTLAAELARELGGVVLGKDQVRAALFPGPALDYSTAQNDISMTAIYTAARYILSTYPGQAVILDGRTFLRNHQFRDLLTLAGSLKESPRVIECVCSVEVARDRLLRDQARGGHPAGNRTFALYQEVLARAEPISVPHLTLDTGTLTLQECLQRSLSYLE